MTERERPLLPDHPHHHQSQEQNASRRDMSFSGDRGTDWDWSELAEALDSEPHETRHVAWGDGTTYRVGRDPETATQMEIFPESGVARVISQHAEITLFRHVSPSRYRDRIRFEADTPDERIDLTLTRHGRLRLDITPALPGRDLEAQSEAPATTPPLAPESPVLAHPDVREQPIASSPTTHDIAQTGGVVDMDGTEIPVGEETPVLDDSGGAEGHVREPSGTLVNDQKSIERGDHTEKPERLNLSGRLGRTPSFRTTRNGTLVGSFPLAVRNDDGSTTWHTVLAFGERAEKLQEGLTKGQPIEVIGYLHQRERTLRSGEIRTIEEIYATVVKPR